MILLDTSVGENVFTGKKRKKIELLTYVMIGFVLILTLFGCINIYKSCQIINTQANANFIYLTKSIKQSENNYFHDAEEEAKHCKKAIELTINLQELNKIAPNVHKYNKYKIPYISNYFNSIVSPLLLYSTNHMQGLVSIYFTFDNKFLIHKDVLGLWYADPKLNGNFKFTDNGQVTDMYPQNRPGLEWYYAPKTLKKGVWSAPYIDNDIKIDMITYSTPVYSGKKFLGIMGVDISMDKIKDYIYKFKIYKTGKAYLIDKSNQIIFAKNYKALTSTSEIDKNLFHFLNSYSTKDGIKLKTDEIKFLKSGASKIFTVTQLYNGFILALEVPTAELYAETIKLITLTSILLLLAVIIVSLITITANKKIKKINNELMHKEKYTRTVLDNIKDGIITINDDFVIEDFNPAIGTIFNYSLSEIVGKKLDLLMHYECDNQEKKICLSKKETSGLRKNGEEFPIEIDVSEINFENKILTLLVIRDVTELKKVDRMKNEFISTVSHELRTPLTSIKGALGLVASGAIGELPEKINKMLNIADTNCTRLANLINDILDLEKINAGKMEFEFEELEINEILKQSLVLNQPYVDQYGMKIKMIQCAEKTYVSADKNRLLQVISNLISNAVKFSNPGGEILIVAERENDIVKISFVDKGIGVPESSKHKIFQSFSQVDSSDTRSKGGSGLGLSISKIIITKMGGEIGFESVENKGSTFFFILPRTNKP